MVDINPLTAKNNCSRRHFQILFLLVKENKFWHFMWIVCVADDSHKNVKTNFLGKIKTNLKWRLLQILFGALRDNTANNHSIYTDQNNGLAKEKITCLMSNAAAADMLIMAAVNSRWVLRLQNFEERTSRLSYYQTRVSECRTAKSHNTLVISGNIVSVWSRPTRFKFKMHVLNKGKCTLNKMLVW